MKSFFFNFNIFFLNLVLDNIESRFRVIEILLPKGFVFAAILLNNKITKKFVVKAGNFRNEFVVIGRNINAQLYGQP